MRNQALRNLLFFTFAFFFTAGVAFGQNQATVTQSGTNNDATLEQEHTGSQGTNEVFVNQSGTENEVTEFSQWGSGNYAQLEQKGTENVIRKWSEQGVRKYGTPTGPSFNGYQEVTQDGQKNVVHDLDQAGWNNSADINQTGKKNFVDLETQYSELGRLAVNNRVEIEQVGSNNRIGDRTGTRGVHQQTNNDLIINQQGSRNRAGVKTLSEAGITDFGPNPLVGSGENSGKNQSIVQAQFNYLEISQNGIGNVVEYVLQNGSENTGLIFQEVKASDNTASLIQRGNNHFAEIDQSGSDHTARVTQDNSHNSAWVTQTGTGNTATVTQQ